MARKTSPITESKKIESQYRQSLLVRVNWLKEHEAQIIRELKSNKEAFQVDAPATDLTAKINRLRELYRQRFPALQTQRLATAFYKRIESYNSKKMNSAFGAMGIDLESALKREKLTDFANIAIKNNVDLIKSVGDEYFDRMEKIVLNGMMSGEEWATIGKRIQEATGATAKRAAFIARDQSSTITGMLSKQRALNAGIKKAIWVKTKSTKTKNYTPRKSHIAADGKEFSIEKGLLVDGEYIFPSQKIGCTCLARFIVD